ncbi:hypothetical protein [Polyangium spumosum]|uniref:SH3 domain-containing protein n=1 Tax=Polyangium spumosum TaxID=889282 RepID=A0A6N7PZR6_9BACT|nr:hypothetical protein [Polyangium spumosum]MRG97493.1 hypothetical protein [Polyangium spumosum]
MRRTVLASLMMLAAGLAVAHAASPERPAENPLLRYALGPSAKFGFTGRVEERLSAGSYLYLRVRDAAGAGHWVATLTSTASAADDVDVRVFARAENFQSRRLGRDFSPLLFGAVRSRSPENR